MCSRYSVWRSIWHIVVIEASNSHHRDKTMADGESNATAEQAFQLRKWAIWFKLPIGAVNACLNLIGTLALAWNRKLRSNNTFIFIAYSSASFVVTGVGAIVDSTISLSDGMSGPNRSGFVLTELSCFQQRFVRELGSYMVTTGYLLTAVDRFVAVFTPHFYSVGMLSVRYLTLVDETIVQCSVISQGSDVTLKFEISLVLSLHAVTLLFCISLMLRIHYSRMNRVQSGMEMRHRKRRRILTTLCISCASYTATLVTGTVLEEISLAQSDLITGIFYGNFVVLVDFSGLISFCVFYTTSAEYRLSVKRLIRKCFNLCGHQQHSNNQISITVVGSSLAKD
ncbi:Melanocyte-stimulating hormone receptor [Trichinella spiralis]|uniref:Melanocyte-stimulating hormone receptor n=1 Tax=Trichinella spiralis TaxID=6334 RepID=A0ABR3KT65_TRISP